MYTAHLSRHRFDSLEEMADEVRGWDVEFRPMAADTGGTELAQMHLGPVMVTHLSTECRHVHQGAAPQAMYTFALLADGDQTVRWCGSLLDVTRLPVFGPAEDFTASASPRFSVFTLSVDPAWLHQTAGGERFDIGQGRRKLLRIHDPRAVARLRRTVSDVCGLLTAAPSATGDRALVVTTLAGDLMSGLISVIDDATAIQETVPAAARARAVRRAVAFMRSRSDEALRLDDIAKVAKVSERTLQRAFREHFGVTPKAYLLGLRLGGVRNELLRHGPTELRVRDAAARWGFWHMGQFADDYRRRFGELPSQTLARSHRSMGECSIEGIGIPN